jgi:hypothetical protein
MQDGQGFFYGELKVGHVQHRLNLLPPRSYAHPWFVLGPRDHMHETSWLVFVDGEQVASAPSREQAVRAVRDWAAGE